MAAPQTPRVTVDIVIRLKGEPEGLVLVERRHPPQGLALPGGFVDVGEWVEDAARREAYEETGLQVALETLLGCYSDPQRDARGHTVSLVYVGTAEGHPRAGSDAAACQVVSAFRVDLPLVFDHARILEDYRTFLRTGAVPRPRPGNVTAAIP